MHATATLLDPHARIRCAVSTETATHPLDVLTNARNNLFAIRRGLDGADEALLEELTDLHQRPPDGHPAQEEAAGLAR